MLIKNDIPILEFDEAKEALINPCDIVKRTGRIGCERLVITFFGEVIEELLSDGKIEKIKTVIGENPYVIYKFMDCDVLFAEEFGITPAECITKEGEEEFRRKESELIAEISKKNSSVIATGGGAVLKKENVRAIKRNSIVVFVDRPLDMLVATNDRPLSSSVDKVKKLYEQRYDIYKSVADEIADGSGDIDEVANRIRRKLGI